MKLAKGILLISALGSIALTSCGNEASTSVEQRIETSLACPSGAPAVSLFAHLDDSNVEIGSADVVQSYLTDTANKDIVILPTNYGVNAIVNSHVSFKIAATVTFGNFFLLSTGLDNDNVINDGDKVLAFQQNGAAGKVFNYIYDDLNLEVDYLLNASKVKDAILNADDSFDYDYVLLAQPVVNAILANKSSYAIYANIQEEYKTKSGGKEITQASIFVKNSADGEKVKATLATIKYDVERLLNDTSLIISETSHLANEYVSGKLSSPASTIKNLLDNNNQIGLGYKDAYGNKASIDAFLETLGLEATSEEIYFRA